MVDHNKIGESMGKVALVTGASSGIGVHFASQLFKSGYNVLLVSNRKEEVESVAEIIMRDYGGPARQGNNRFAIGFFKDLALADSAYELYDYCNSNGYEVEVLVNNAGVFFFKDLVDCTPQQVEMMLTLHVYAITILCRLFGEQMRRRGRGYILNMSSISVYTPYPGISLYTATKSYLRTFGIAFRLEMMEYGVRVLTVCPGAVATDLYNLSKNLQNIGVKAGIIYKPDKLVRKALHKLFNGRRAVYVPGFLNHFFKPIYAVLPLWFKMRVRRKIKNKK